VTDAAAIESPCIRECRVDQVTGYCVGCYRTLREISYWETYTPHEQHRILALIDARRETDRKDARR
jgi:uncharacterized protein